MTVTVLVILAILVMLLSVANALGKCPIWVPMVLAGVYMLVQQLPKGDG